MISPYRWTAGHTALAVGMVVSAAMQVAYSIDHGFVRLVAGLAAVAVIPSGMHLWHHIPVTGWPTRVARALAVSGVVLAAMTVNGAHAVILLTSRGENPILALLIVLAVESLMVMASLATRAHPAAAAGTETAGTTVRCARWWGRARQGAQRMVSARRTVRVADPDDLLAVEASDPLAGDGRESHPAPPAGADLMSPAHRERVEAIRERVVEANRRALLRLVPAAVDPDVDDVDAAVDEAPVDEPAGESPTYLEQARAARNAAIVDAAVNGSPIPPMSPRWVRDVTGCSRAQSQRVAKLLAQETEGARAQ